MIAHLRLIGLKQILKQLAESDDSLRRRVQSVELAEILAVHSSENVIAFLNFGRDVNKRTHKGVELVNWQDSAGGVHALVPVIRAETD